MLNIFKRKNISKEPQAIINHENVHLDVLLCIKNICKARISCVVENSTTILIGDITCNNDADVNKGYGSLMMRELIAYAKEKGFARIYGNLADIDMGHRERLYHFYKKFGFSITEYQELQDCYVGQIEKLL